MIIHEQFHSNHSTKHIFTQKIYFRVTIPRNSKTLGFTVPSLINSLLHFVNLHFTAISGLIQTTIQSMAWITPLDTQTVREQSRTVNLGSINPTSRSQVLGPIKRPLTALFSSNICKVFKRGNKTQVGRNPYLSEF